MRRVVETRWRVNSCLVPSIGCSSIRLHTLGCNKLDWFIVDVNLHILNFLTILHSWLTLLKWDAGV